MMLTKWNPFQDVADAHSRFNRFFDPALWRMGDGEEASALTLWNPAVDIYETDEAIVIKAELPGVDKEHISIDLKDRVLTMRGERSEEKEVKEEKFYRKERVYGKFQRSFNLPDNCDAEKISAGFSDGVLKIEIPKPEQEKPKQITVH